MKPQPQNGLVIKGFFTDVHDKELIRLIPLLVFLSEVDDVRTVRDWNRKFKELEKISYTSIDREPSVLFRNSFLKTVVNKLHKEYLDLVFHGKKGASTNKLVEAPTKLCSTRKLLCESMEDLATSDVDYEEIHK